jgi:hypothetical protein
LHYKSECPELKLLDSVVQKLSVDDCDEEHNLFLASDGYGFVQKQSKGVRGILSPYHAYINTCTSYSIWKELISSLKGKPKTLRLAMPTSGCSTLQKWQQRRS